MKSFEKLLMENKKWASDKQKIDPNFFKHLAKEQKPEFLWIGCSDSRVPAELIVNAEPGEMFIHRNIANQMVATDFNCLSVLQYAVAVLKVKHIIVCGHYNCGGVKAALNNQSTDLVLTNKWLMHIKNVYRLHQKEVNALATEQERIDRLVELNVIEQVKTLAYTSIIQQAWHEESRPIIHGWVYGLSDGLLKTLISMEPGHEIEPIFKYDYTEAVA
ncbi:MAG: carbonic anhydrase [Gammaproteobacteria bacterium]|uniref:carbonic anhydrase n=1 Tax=Methylotuvimicrobium sp. TaxID=2822413 RepID=UPI001D92700E|nr:carbonic anhydrase [Gammaproteobacteria bacterium]